MILAFATWLDDKLDRFVRDFRPAPDVTRERLKKEWKGDGKHRAALRKALVAMSKRQMETAHRTLVTAVHGKQDGKGKLVVAKPPQRYETPLLLTREEACTSAYMLLDISLAKGDHRAAKYLAEQLAKGRGGLCNGAVQQMVLARAAVKAAKHGAAMKHFEAAAGFDPRDGTVLRMWLRATRKKDGALRAKLARQMIALMPNDVLAPMMLASRSWRLLAPSLGMPPPRSVAGAKGSEKAAAMTKTTATAKIKPAPTKLDPTRAKAWLADLALGHKRLEEVVPTRRVSVLYEARLAVANKRLKWALPIYREAARRSETAQERAEAWCELAVAAKVAKAKDDLGEATRRCAAAKSK